MVSDATYPSSRIAVIGAGMAGSACASALLRSGFEVVVFDKSNGVGGRMATRRAPCGEAGETALAFDHGVSHFTATRSRFRSVVARAEALGVVASWSPLVHRGFPGIASRGAFVPVPTMSSFCKHLLTGVPARLGQAVTRLHRHHDGWELRLADGSAAGPFAQVVVALPAPQAALLLAGHDDAEAEALAAVVMSPCWTLMAVTDDVDWPWDIADPDAGPLARVVRDDRKPGRTPGDGAHWVAHASHAWSRAHVDDDAAAVRVALCAALAKLLPDGASLPWRHAVAHRWRYAVAASVADGAADCWWDGTLGLGVCGDSFGDGSVESAWRSGDELADTVAAFIGFEREAVTAGEPLVADPVH